MELRTIVEIPKYDFKINYTDKCFFIGSCFSENIGDKLLKSKIPTLINPTGTHYNPFSIAHSIENIINCKKFSEKKLFFSNGQWNCYDFHSKFSGNSAKEVLNNINSAISISNKFLQQADYLFVAFGTSLVYCLKDNFEIVSNCHKQKSALFEHFMLSDETISQKWVKILELLEDFNPKLKIIFTVSPIRHVKNGAIENMQSKANLIIAIKNLSEITTIKNIYYFPVYEIVNDELRDYRFYADDMQHISKLAIDYIWEIFQKEIFTQKTTEFVKQINSIEKALFHKPLSHNTEEFRKFCKSQIEKIKNIEQTYKINLTEAKEAFERSLE
ncbi:MAG: GSCFA domain-containing protein [Bacteroidales bacterium]|jgi:hypothetical protein|nr:GSCFA domain-containing protein [Bacteroidales bacterium]